jgi:integrase
VRGKDRRLGLGSYPTVSLADARRLREQQRRLRKEQRLDPIAERRSQDQARELAEQQAAEAAAVAKTRSVTFCQAANEYIAAHKPEWGAKYASQWEALIQTYAHPVIGDVPVADVDVEHLLSILRPIWLSKTITAKRLRGMLAVILDWCANKPKTPYRAKGVNPAAWKHNLEHADLPKPSKIATVKNRPALPWQDTREFMATLRQHNSIAAMALQFAILTAARTGEVRLATWSEIDIKHRVWRIAASRMKAARPYSDAVIEILTTLKDDTTPGKRDYVFAEPTGRPLPEKALRHACHRINPTITVHGMRSTFRWAGNATKFPRELADRALGQLMAQVRHGNVPAIPFEQPVNPIVSTAPTLGASKACRSCAGSQSTKQNGSRAIAPFPPLFHEQLGHSHGLRCGEVCTCMWRAFQASQLGQSPFIG